MFVREMFRFNSFSMFAKQRCDIHHNSMRSRQIFEIIDYLDRIHFALQNEFSIICFTH